MRGVPARLVRSRVVLIEIGYVASPPGTAVNTKLDARVDVGGVVSAAEVIRVKSDQRALATGATVTVQMILSPI